MCRINAIIGNIPNKAQVMHIMMLYASTEKWQVDGWGVTDGVEMDRSGLAFHENGGIMNDLDPSRLWLGHIRAASIGTQIGMEAAHPYHFNLFYGVHNGWMHEIIKPQIVGPDTDSFRAFYILARICARDRITSDTLYTALHEYAFREWMSLYGPDTTFAFGLHTRDSLIFIRNEKKELWMVDVGGGTLINTSKEALYKTLVYGERYLQLNISGTNIVRFSDPNILVEVKHDGRMDFNEVAYDFAPRPAKRKKGKRS